MRLAAAVVTALLLSATSAAAQAREWWPGSTYDPKVPTPRSVLGYDIGDDYTEHGEMLAYMRQLEAASDGRIKIFSVGKTNERRELILMAVSDPANIRRLEEIRTTVERLRDPRALTEAEAREIAKSTPAIAWMNFANDGNETAAFEAAIQLAYHLAAGTDDTTRQILREVVTIIYPAHNPESHSRHVAWMKASATGNPDPQAQEHRGDWRMDSNNNHYQIDLNRDGVFLSQVESRTIVREIHRWNPVVFVDHHGNPDRFFFPPWALPVNAQLDDTARKWSETYGRNIAAAFDRHGWTYFTRQVYDLHYPGYYDSYPSLNGATGMTFETDGGGNKGFAYRLPDGRVTTLFDGTLHHFTGSIASLLTTAAIREARLMHLYRFRASALAEAATDKVKQFVLAPGADPGRTADLVELLLAHQIEVFKATSGFGSAAAHDLATNVASKRAFDAGVFVIPAAQPQKRLLRTLLDRETPLEKGFLDEVVKAKAYNDNAGDNAPKKPYGFYDINAWSLPLAYGVQAWWSEDTAPVAALERVTSRPEPPVAAAARARYAYLFAWNTRGAAELVSALWKEDFQVAVATEAFSIGDREFPKGVAVVRTQSNPDSIHARMAALARDAGVQIVPVDTAWADKGRDLGDRTVVDLKKPSIVVVSEPPTSATAFGAVWFLLDERYGVPITIIRAQDLASAELNGYNVIVLPDGSASGYARTLGEEGAAKLKAWVREGGTLVTIKGATAWASGEKVGLSTARDRFAPPADGDKGTKEPPKRIDQIPGAFVRLNVDREHYLGLGMDAQAIGLLVRSNVIYDPTKKGARVVSLDTEDPVVAGFVFDEARDPLKGAPFVWDEPTGRGHVTCFADDVAFRTFVHGTHRLLLNAVLLGPSF